MTEPLLCPQCEHRNCTCDIPRVKIMGRPSDYSEEVVDTICARLSEGESLREICKDDKLPTMSCVMNWLNDPTKKYLSEQYTKAREKQAQVLFDDILKIADDGTNDWVEKNDPENPGYVLNGEHYQRSRLRIDTRKWYLSKVLPKKYADTTKLEHSGVDGKPIEHNITGNVIVFKQFTDGTDSKPSI